MKFKDSDNQVFSIILSGGEGTRLRPFIQNWLGYPQPKQYCAFLGSRSMLQHTWDRATLFAQPANLVTVVAQHHHPYVLSGMSQEQPGRIVFQPENRETAAGLFLALTYIRAQNPQATVVCCPADHFVGNKEGFVATVQQTIQAIRVVPDKILLLGVSPTNLDLDYGWIVPGGPLCGNYELRVQRVHKFLEKPDGLQGLAALSHGGLWNTFIMTAKVETLWRLGWKCVPEVMEQFQTLEKVIGTAQEQSTLETIYQHMPRRNVSSDLIQQVPEALGVIELKNVQWSDWGRPERIIETLRALGKDTAHFEGFIQKQDLVEVGN